ncbi:hypothetical protein JCM8547_003420 [Rhodosporidiobolus lusitaniae]
MTTRKPSSLSLSPFDLPSPGLLHFNRLAGTQSGQDKLFMVYQYAAYVACALLNSKRFGTKARRDLAGRIEKLRATISDARVLYRLFGLFPMIAWAQSLNTEEAKKKDKQLLRLEKLQAWSMILYYPLEHIYYLAGKGVFRISPKRITTIALWSCRFWAAYVALQIFHIRRSFQLLSLDRAALVRQTRERVRGGGEVTLEAVQEEKEQTRALRKRESNLRRDCWVQAGYLPLTAHWSLPNGLLPSNTWVGVCGTVAAVAGLKGVWQATA